METILPVVLLATPRIPSYFFIVYPSSPITIHVTLGSEINVGSGIDVGEERF